MKLLIILTTFVVAIPGGSWSQPAAELEHLAESAVVSYGTLHSPVTEQVQAPGLLTSLRNGATKFANKIMGNELHEIGEISHTIPLYENIAFTFNQIDAGYWDRFVDINIKMNRVIKRFLSEEEAVIHFSPDGDEVKTWLEALRQYVKESRLDSHGRVRKSTYRNAKQALSAIISFQHEHNLGSTRTTSKWELPEFARVRLSEMVKKDEAESVANMV
jgi:hypothetical protein